MKLCQSLVEKSAVNGPANFDKSMLEISRAIEKTHHIEKCYILRALGRCFSDNKDINIDIKDSKFLEEINDTFSPIVINEVKSNPNLSKELFRLFSVRAFNMLFLPIIQKK